MKLGEKVELSKYGRAKLATLPSNTLPIYVRGVVVGINENTYRVRFENRGNVITTIKRRFVRKYRGKN